MNRDRTMPENRRGFLTKAAGVAAALSFGRVWAAEGARRPRVLLRSSWQTVNIGDIAHTPGLLAVLEKQLPEVEVQLWPNNVDNGVKEVLQRRFPKVAIVQGRDAVDAAFAECDFLLHGSGPSLVAAKDVARWRAKTGKPYGIGGITLARVDKDSADLLSGARFVFFRDSVSLQLAKDNGVTCPVMEFGPDGAFGVDLRNDEAATLFLREHGLEEGRFVCCIPRLRYTPYWKIHNTPMNDEAKRKDARNQEMKGHDHAPLLAAIVAVVRQAKMKVLVCPEDRSQMDVGKEMLVDRLPEDVRASVVWREKYWLTDEAVSTYIRSAGLFGMEMHSPIMCIGNGVPAIVGRFAEQTSKGMMWRDIGLGDWLFDMDIEEDVARYPQAVLAMVQDPKAAKEKAAKALEFVKQRQAVMMNQLRESLRIPG